MKLSKKFLAVAMSGAVVASVSAAGTLAYLTSQDTAVNTFTVGKVAITLDEAKVGPDGKALTGADAERVKENEYLNVLPGADLDKDPTVTVAADSADCYVYVAVRNYVTGEDRWDRYVDCEYDTVNWKSNGYFVPSNYWGDDKGFRIEIFRYNGSLADENGVIQSGDEAVVLEPVFDKMHVANSLTSEQAAEMVGNKVVVKAFAVQADNLEVEKNEWAQEILTGAAAADKMADEFFTDPKNWKN